MEQDEFPMRVNKYLARQGIATRREADTFIEKELVLINGRIAALGDKVSESDTVEVRKRKGGQKQHLYFAYNKPRGMATPQRGAKDTDSDDTTDVPPEAKRLGLFPVGRLDKDSHGLLILTNDGRITDRLLNPDKQHDKEYTVRVKFPLRKNFKQHMEAGVDIEGYMTKPAKVRINGEKSFTVTLTEGKKHQIRRMVVALYNEVDELKRTRVMNVKLGTLKSGELRPIEGAELSEFLESLGLAAAQASV